MATLSINWPLTSGAPPAHATTRNIAAWSEGAMVATLAESLGTPLLPWQRYVADVAGEKLPDGSYAYDTIVVSVPRQCGKTTLIRSVGALRALVYGHQAFYTAQTGKDARARWVELVTALQQSPALRHKVKVALRGGSEHILFQGSGGVFQCFAPTDDALHGSHPHLVFLDEVFAHDARRGELLMGAIAPAQQNVLAKQKWIVSTAGHAGSTFLHDWIDRAVAGAPRVAGFVWGAQEHHDPFDLDDIAAYHPGVGFRLDEKTLTARDVLSEAEGMTRAEYERAFANRRTVTASHLIPAADWRALRIPDLPPPADVSRDLVIGYDVAFDRQSATILAAWRHTDPDGRRRLVGDIVQAQEGTSWLAPAVEDLQRRWRPLAVTAAGNGPVIEHTQQLLDRGIDVEVLTEREYAAATSSFLTLIDDRTIGHTGDALLEEHVAGLAARTSAGDGLAISRRHSVGDTSAGVAFLAAAWGVQRHEQGKPVIYFKTT